MKNTSKMETVWFEINSTVWTIWGLVSKSSLSWADRVFGCSFSTESSRESNSLLVIFVISTLMSLVFELVAYSVRATWISFVILFRSLTTESSLAILETASTRFWTCSRKWSNLSILDMVSSLLLFKEGDCGSMVRGKAQVKFHLSGSFGKRRKTRKWVWCLIINLIVVYKCKINK